MASISYQNTQLGSECALVAVLNCARFFGIDVPDMESDKYAGLLAWVGGLHGTCLKGGPEAVARRMGLVPVRPLIASLHALLPPFVMTDPEDDFHMIAVVARCWTRDYPDGDWLIVNATPEGPRDQSASKRDCRWVREDVLERCLRQHPADVLMYRRASEYASTGRFLITPHDAPGGIPGLRVQRIGPPATTFDGDTPVWVDESILCVYQSEAYSPAAERRLERVFHAGVESGREQGRKDAQAAIRAALGMS